MKKIALIASFWMWSISVVFATETFEEKFLNLGVDEDFTKLERGLIKEQVKNFIPPLLVPAIGGHAYVLPPGLFNFSTSFKFVNVDEDDYASYLNWLTHSDATLTFPQTVFIRYTLQEPGVADKAAEGYRRWFVARLKLLEETLNNREYLCSNRFTIADICVSYAIFLAGNLGIEEAYKPNIKRWTDMLFEREAFKKIKKLRYEE